MSEIIKKYLTAQEVADRLSISLKAVYSLAQRGLIRSYKFGRLVRFDPDDVDDYIKRSQRVLPSNPKVTVESQPVPGVTA